MLLWMMRLGFENICRVSGKWNKDAGLFQDFIFWCCIWFNSRELGGGLSPRFPCVTPVMESFSSDLLRAIISFWTKLHLEFCQISTMELFCEDSRRAKDVDYFCRKCSTADVRLDSKCASDWKSAVNVGFR